MAEEHEAPQLETHDRTLTEAQRDNLRLHTIIQAIEDGVLVADAREHSLVLANRSMCRMLGYTEAELLNLSLDDLHPAESLATIHEAIQQQLEHGAARASDVPLLHKNGSVVFADLSSRVLDSGGSACLVAVFRDATERRNREEELRDSHEQYKRMFETVQDVYYEVSLDGTILQISPSIEVVSGYSRAELLGADVSTIYANPEARRALLEQVTTKGRALDYPIEFKDRDGKLRACAVSVSLIRDEGNNPIGLSGLLRDVSERVRAEEALRSSEQKFSRAFHSSPILMTISSIEDGRYLEVNDTFTESTGYSREATIGATSTELGFISNEDRSMLAEQIRRNGSVRDLELTLHHASGREMICLYSGELLEIDGTEKLLSLAVDITDRKHAETRLQRSEEMFRTAFLTSPDAVNINRLSDGQYVAINHGFTRIMGYTEEDVQGKTSAELGIWCHAGDRDRLVDQLTTAGTCEGLEARFQAKDGEIRDGLMSATIVEMDGERHILSITRDITEHRRLQERVRQMEKMDAIGQLAGGIAHDFNNQLAGIMGFADLLHQLLDEPKLKSYVEHIITGARRSADLTNQLLAFSRRRDQLATPSDLHTIIRETVQILTRSIDKRIAVTLELNAARHTVMGDASQLQNAALNLGVNARDAMPDGGELIFETSNLTLSPTQALDMPQTVDPGEFLVLRVRDTGCGMSESVRERVFEPFFTTKEMGKGTGMGLAAVFGTIRQHHGAISVESEVGAGTCFEIFLPTSDSTERQSRSRAVDSSALMGRRVLLIDDEEMVRKLVVDMLRSHGCHIHAEHDGAAGVAYYQRHWTEVDLIILDMIMPRMSGRDAFAALREINPAARIVIASGFSAGDDVQELLDRGAIGFLKKPFRHETLVAKLTIALREIGSA